MNFYTSDLHFGHENVIKLCGRPFSCVEEMDEYLIREWNKAVHKDDRVYIVGDLIFRSKNPPEFYLDRLKGKKHLVVGNHDSSWMGKTDLSKYFESVEKMTSVNTGKGKALLCHFPLLDFDEKFLIHGHIHSKAEKLDYWSFLKNADNLLNAGIDINGYRPVLFEQLLENNFRFKSEH